MNKPPILKINLLEAIAAIVIITIFVAGFHAILPLANYAVYLVIGAALAYAGLLGYHTYQHRRKLAAISLERQQALADRERIVNAQEQAKTLALIQPDASTGNYPIWIDAYGQPHVFQPGNLVQPVPHTLHFAPHTDYRVAGKEVAAAPEVPAIAGPLPLPGPVSMVEVMKHFSLSPEHLFLALGRGGRQLTCAIDEFMHVAHDGPTGSGKTMQWKAEIVMLLKADILTFLANPHFAPVTKKGEDWRPIGRALEAQELPGQLPGLLYTFEHIRDFLRWLSQVEIDRRFEHQRAGRYDYAPLYGFVDEWAAQVAKYPECGAYMQDIIRRGRAVDVCISTNSQGFLVNDIGMSGASRENFQTAYHLGGSVQSASALLDMRQQDITKLLAAEQVALGKGIGLLRNNSVSDPAQLVRLPLADNEYVYYMLGRAEGWTLSEQEGVRKTFSREELGRKISEISEDGLEADEQHFQGGFVRNLSTFLGRAPVEREITVPAEIRDKIIALHHKGFKRTQIRDAIGLNGEEYKMVKAVLDTHQCQHCKPGEREG